MRDTLFAKKEVQRSRSKQLGAPTANELTQQILKWARFHRYFASRVNTAGIYDQRTGRYRTGTTRKGFPDVVIIANGLFYGVEVKAGRDQQSQEQRNCQLEIEAAGGTYILARTLEDVAKVIKFSFNEGAI